MHGFSFLLMNLEMTYLSHGDEINARFAIELFKAEIFLCMKPFQLREYWEFDMRE